MNRGSLNQTNAACVTTISTPNIAVASFPQSFDKYKYSSHCYNRINITVTALWVATPILSTVSVAAVCVAVSTSHWLLTQESIKNENYTGRGDHEYFPKHTVSGLWTLCYTNPGKEAFLCSSIEYFPKEEYSPDLKDSTMAIPYSVTKSAIFFILSTFLLFLGEFCCLCGHCSRQRRLFTFISGVIFIISGLLMLIGLVMYISVFKAEVGGKLRATSQLQPAVFTYQYGYSFILYVFGFIVTEISGTCSVFLYIYWHQKDWRKKGYELRMKFASPIALLNTNRPENSYLFCKKHPNKMCSDSIGRSPSAGISKNFTSVLQRRLYLDSQSDSYSDEGYPSPVCLKYSASCSYFNEDDMSFLPKKQNRKTGTRDLKEDSLHLPSELCNFHLMSASSFEFITKNIFPKNASTNTSLIWKETEMDNLNNCILNPNHDHEFIPFDLDKNSLPIFSLFDSSKSAVQLQNENCFYDVLRKTTPV